MDMKLNVNTLIWLLLKKKENIYGHFANQLFIYGI